MERFESLDYRCRCYEEQSTGNLVILMERKIEGIPFKTEYHITQDYLGLNKKDFCRINKILDHVLDKLSYSLSDYIKNKLKC